MTEECPYCGAGRSNVLPFGELVDGLFQCGTSAKDGEVAVRGLGCIEYSLMNTEADLSMANWEIRDLAATIAELRGLLSGARDTIKSLASENMMEDGEIDPVASHLLVRIDAAIEGED